MNKKEKKEDIQKVDVIIPDEQIKNDSIEAESIELSKESDCETLVSCFNKKEIRTFLIELLKACLKSIKTNSFAPIKEEIISWEATAEILANKKLARDIKKAKKDIKKGKVIKGEDFLKMHGYSD